MESKDALNRHPRRARAQSLRRAQPLAKLAAAAVAVVLGVGLAGCTASPRPTGEETLPPANSGSGKVASASGTGGAVVSDTVQSTRAGMNVLKSGGNAADAAVATAAALGVTDPFVAGIGGGGYLVYYDAKTGKVSTIDGRETAPAAADSNYFVDPKTSKPYDMDTATKGGLATGTPGQLALWQHALQRWGSKSLSDMLQPAIGLAEDGFPITTALNQQIADNQKTFSTFTATKNMFLPDGKPLRAGTIFKNPDLAATYRQIASEGPGAFYQGPLGAAAVDAADHPGFAAGQSATTGKLSTDDLAAYRVKDADPVHSTYRGMDVYGMGSSSSGGVAVGEGLKILESFPLSSESQLDYLQQYLQASELAFADRNAYVGDRSSVRVPDSTLLSDAFAQSRSCLIHDGVALPAPQPAGNLSATSAGGGTGACAAVGRGSEPNPEGQQTNHFVVTDAQGNVASYTNTLNYYGGGGIMVPGYGFMLNDELTDFTFAQKAGAPPEVNLPAPNKRPRSSMSPTIVLKDGKPYLAVGSPGGSTIITTVLQVITERVDRGMSLEQAIAAPRASQENSAITQAEPGFVQEPEAGALTQEGFSFKVAPSSDQNPSSTTPATIGVVAAVEFGPGGALTAVGETQRRGGTSAEVAAPSGASG